MCRRIGTVVGQNGTAVKISKLSCKSWDCPDCAPKRRGRLVAEAKEGRPNRFITLTVNPNWFDSPEERARRLVIAWRRFTQWFKRKNKTAEFEYLCVFEATKLGEPHLHICFRGAWIYQRTLSRKMNEYIGAPIVDVRRVKSKSAVAEYVTKYISKRNIKFGTLKRYWRSLKYLAESNTARKKRLNAGWRWWVLEYHHKAYLKMLDARGYDVSPTGADAWSMILGNLETYPPWCTTEPHAGA